MSEAVLDSSALLAVIYDEPGQDVVRAALPDAIMSMVNVAEVISKLRERGFSQPEACASVEAYDLEMVDFDFEQACVAADLRMTTRSAGLSLGDRACLALSKMRGVPAITADRAWIGLAGFDVIAIRGPDPTI